MLDEKKKRYFKKIFREFSKNRGAVIGMVIVVFFVIVSILAPLFSTHDPYEQQLDKFLSAPLTNGFLLGSDDLGRDIYTRILYGARISMVVGIVSVSVALLMGIFFGLISGYFGGWIDVIMMRLVDILLAFPFILLNIVVITILGPSLINAMIAIGISNVPNYIRIVRASVLAEKSEDYVMADKATGASDWYTMFFSVLPNSLAPIFVQATMGLGGAILSAAALSFLGMGAQPPTPEWGLMISSGQEYMLNAWWIVTMPGLAILLTVVGFNLFSDGVRDIMDPRLKE